MTKHEKRRENGIRISHELKTPTSSGFSTICIKDSPLGSRVVIERFARNNGSINFGPTVGRYDRVKLTLRGDKVKARFYSHTQQAKRGGSVTDGIDLSIGDKIQMIEAALDVLKSNEQAFKRSLISAFRDEDADKRFVAIIKKAKEVLQKPDKLIGSKSRNRPNGFDGQNDFFTTPWDRSGRNNVVKSIMEGTKPRSLPQMAHYDGAIKPDTRPMNRAKAALVSARSSISRRIR